MSRTNDSRKDIEFLMKSGEFRRWVLTILEDAGMFGDIFQSGEQDLAYRAGKFGLGNTIMNDLLTVVPTARLLLEQERLAVASLAKEAEHDPADDYR